MKREARTQCSTIIQLEAQLAAAARRPQLRPDTQECAGPSSLPARHHTPDVTHMAAMGLCMPQSAAQPRPHAQHSTHASRAAARAQSGMQPTAAVPPGLPQRTHYPALSDKSRDSHPALDVNSFQADDINALEVLADQADSAELPAGSHAPHSSAQERPGQQRSSAAAMQPDAEAVPEAPAKAGQASPDGQHMPAQQDKVPAEAGSGQQARAAMPAPQRRDALLDIFHSFGDLSQDSSGSSDDERVRMELGSSSHDEGGHRLLLVLRP